VQINPATITATSFEPAFAYQLNSNVLKSFDSVNAGVTVAFEPDKGLSMKITSTLDTMLKNALQREVNAQLSALKDNALKQAKSELDKVTGGLTAQFSDFSNMQSQIMNQSGKLGDYQKQIEAKLGELQSDSKGQADEKLKDSASSALQNLLPGRR
jgi:hypothetical protein